MVIFDLIGSLGLFLLGMWLMTEGLKLAGGPALQTLLGRWTSTRPRGLAAGVLVTALVQSSSAITVATIGFVNAGLMNFQQSVWVIFGSNVGTTITAWLVTLFGFSVDIEAFTFPLFGIGAFLRVFSPFKRGQAMGMALAGFGLLFMGIDALQETFEGLAASFDMGNLAGSGISGLLLWLLIGFVLTLLTQSSSAAIALILTAVASGLVSLNMAIAAVIGANIGTTSTALIATIAATANARRLAFAHVAFNLLTGIVALLLIPLFLMAGEALTGADGFRNPTLLLAVFHTSFNLLGVMLMIPVEPVLSRRLLAMFEPPQRDNRQPSTTLDRNVAAVPHLAMRALGMELVELQSLVGGFGLDSLVLKQHAITGTTGPEGGIDSEQASGAGSDTERAGEKIAELQTLSHLKERLDGVDNFVSLLSQSDLSADLGRRLTAGFATSHYLQNCHEALSAVAGRSAQLAAMDEAVYEPLQRWLEEVVKTGRTLASPGVETGSLDWSALQERYQVFKQEVLSAAVEDRIDMDSVDTALLIGSLSRRFLEQLRQSVTQLEQLQGRSEPPVAVEPGQVSPDPGTAASSETESDTASASAADPESAAGSRAPGSTSRSDATA